jgi:cytochrome c biogenesis protein CcmG/thiol:disulfide interchange protein DsbE
VYQKYKDKGLVMLGIDVPWDTLQPAQLFVQVYKVAYPVGRDASGAISDAYGVQATPTTYFIDQKGILVHRVEGEIEPAELTRRVEALLK